MESAGRGAARFLLASFEGIQNAYLAVLAGRGNNGGDGFVVARYAAQRGIDVVVYLLAEAKRVTGDARANLELLAPLSIPVVEIPDADNLAGYEADMIQHDVWVDAVFGTGLSAAIRGHYREAIDLLNSFQRPVLAIDIPSGVNADNGQICGTCVRAAATATFAYPKIGHVVYPGAQHTGHLEVIDIGIPPHIAEAVAPRQRLTTSEEVAAELVRRAPDDHKGSAGHCLVIAGSTGKTGAAAMACEGAMRTGAGLVTLGVPQCLNPVLETMLLEVMTAPLPDTDGALALKAGDQITHLMADKQCLAIGPGLGSAAETGRLVRQLLRRSKIPMVIDADGLNHLAGRQEIFTDMQAPAVLTPHPGEMARLAGLTTAQVQADRVKCAREFAAASGTVVVLKGAATVIAAPDGYVQVNPTGNPGMASGGMGDVLTGIIAGLITQGIDPERAAVMGVYLHGAAADALAADGRPVGYLAADLLDQVPVQLGLLLNGSHPQGDSHDDS